MFTPQYSAFGGWKTSWWFSEISLAECFRSPYSISPWLLYPHQFWGVNHECPDSETCQLQSLILKSPILKKSFSFSKLMSYSNHENLGFSPGLFPPFFPQVFHRRPCSRPAVHPPAAAQRSRLLARSPASPRTCGWYTAWWKAKGVVKHGKPHLDVV